MVVEKNHMLVSLLFAVVCSHEVASLVINTPCGQLKGAKSPNAAGVYRFLGVPFAETPVRFEKAEQKLSWTGLRDATYYRDSCIQKGMTSKTVFGSEDCLTVDVYTPVDLQNVINPTNQVPVMVWIYGGAFVFGDSRRYEGSKLAQLGNVVVVAIQYRLGAFGWLYSYGTKPSNLGIWDQKLALEWIQRNIHAFGGDNSTVTVFGESAGSMSVSALITSPLVNNSLFQRAIMQSGSVINGDPKQHDRSLELDNLYSLCPKLDIEDRIACLQSLNATAIADHTSSLTNAFNPVPDSQFIMESSSKLLRDFSIGGVKSIQDAIGNVQQYDILSGFNGQEGFLALEPLAKKWKLDLDYGIEDHTYSSIVLAELESITPNLTRYVQGIDRYLQAHYNESLVDHPSKDDNNMNNLLNMLGDFAMTMPTISTARIHSEAVRAAGTGKKTYMYLFDHKPANGSVFVVGPDWLQTSASHGDDVAFVLEFNNRSKHEFLTAEEQMLSDIMMKYWSNFAKTGKPNWEGSHYWKEFTTETANFVRFTLDAVTAEVNPRGDQPQIWDCVYQAVYANDPKLCNSFTTTNYKGDTALGYKVYDSSVVIVGMQELSFLRDDDAINDRAFYSSSNQSQFTAALLIACLLLLN